MGDGSLNISYESLLAAHAAIGNAHMGAKTAIEELQARLDQNLAEWNGDARAAYEQVKLDWAKSFAHMAQVLEQAKGHLSTAHDLYSDVERQNTRIWG